MPFSFTKTAIPDVVLIVPKVFGDSRGYFMETFKQSEFASNGIDYEFNQDNQSRSSSGILRGLHFQNPPYEQGKLVRVIVGEILDVAVDIRKNSSHYGKYVSATLSAENKKMLWIPPGFAHGFFAIEDCVVHYKATKEYNFASEGGIIWNDPTVNVKWPSMTPEISEKDGKWPRISDLNSPF